MRFAAGIAGALMLTALAAPAPAAAAPNATITRSAAVAYGTCPAPVSYTHLTLPTILRV